MLGRDHALAFLAVEHVQKPLDLVFVTFPFGQFRGERLTLVRIDTERLLAPSIEHHNGFLESHIKAGVKAQGFRHHPAPFSGHGRAAHIIQRGDVLHRAVFSIGRRARHRFGHSEEVVHHIRVVDMQVEGNAAALALVAEPAFPLLPARRRTETAERGRNHLAVLFTVHQFLEINIRRPETQAMRDHQLRTLARLPGSREHLVAFRRVQRHGLFAQHAHPGLQRLARQSDVQRRRQRQRDHIRFSLGQHRVEVIINHGIPEIGRRVRPRDIPAQNRRRELGHVFIAQRNDFCAFHFFPVAVVHPPHETEAYNRHPFHGVFFPRHSCPPYYTFSFNRPMR